MPPDAAPLRLRIQLDPLFGLCAFARDLASPSPVSGSFANGLRRTFVAHRRVATIVERLSAERLPAGAAWGRRAAPERLVDVLPRIAAVSNGHRTFAARLRKAAPSSAARALALLRELEQPFRETVWRDASELDGVARGLAALARDERVEAHLSAVRDFYGASPVRRVTVELLPLPRENGEQQAAWDGDLVTMNVRAGGSRLSTLFGILAHELCHALYERRARAVDADLRHRVCAARDLQPLRAYLWLDEALATCIGNAFTVERIFGEEPEDEWYHHERIDASAKALAPLASQYLRRRRVLDGDLLASAVQRLRRAFGRVVSASELLAQVVVLADASFEDVPRLVNTVVEEWAVQSLDVMPLDARSARIASRRLLPVLVVVRRGSPAARSLHRTIPWLHPVGVDPARNLGVLRIGRDARVTTVLVLDRVEDVRPHLRQLQAARAERGALVTTSGILPAPPARPGSASSPLRLGPAPTPARRAPSPR